ncbi:2-oxoglutarate and iron-dependent oxygenase domain-containing protein [Streptomyces sp. NBC_00154]|uniref:2-oxoglutarate and iron-dependent oxygenase domain-containing protein n=1 Tax=Streptomyces sp. NBC_00154 TaxID=2975670 RepID=UPI002258CE5E|nr:2-oxoglutarate and iron-dependent oxygenase domain-containing protein [Streptomyces sp. NBC_00154]MCX5316955.1 2-oxoglutarate and iron-dependent oxygenase domain-containing protein [Streptomyces sp. NBC_00154]
MADITTRAVPHTTPQSTYGLAELDKETRMGGAGTETTAREIRRIDLSDFEAREAEITEELWAAATDIGFFQLVNHGIEQALVDEAFTNAKEFFALPE